MKQVLIFGAGEHAAVCIDILRLRGYRPVGLVGKSSEKGRVVSGVAVTGDEKDPAVLAFLKRKTPFFIAIGDNALREKITKMACSVSGREPVNVVHPHVVVSKSANVGTGVFLNAGTVINAGVLLGNHVIIEANTVISSHCVLADYVRIAPGVNLASNVKIGRGAFIGVGADVIPDKIIGEGAIVGAGAVVVGDIPPHVTAVGVPAVVIKRHKRER